MRTDDGGELKIVDKWVREEMKQTSRRERTGSTRFREACGTLHDRAGAPGEAVEILDLGPTSHHGKGRNRNDPKDQPQVLCLIREKRLELVICSNSVGGDSVLGQCRGLVPRTTQKRCMLLARPQWLPGAGMMRSTRLVKPKASGMGERASLRGVQRSQRRKNLHSKICEGLREQVRDVDHQADGFTLGKK